MNDPVTVSQTASPPVKPTVSSLSVLPAVAGTGKWHLLTILAGCVLIATFFLPICRVDNWSTNEVPARLFRDLLRESDVRQAISQGPGSLSTLVYLIAAAILPHVWGLLTTLFGVMSVLGWTRLRKVPQAVGARPQPDFL